MLINKKIIKSLQITKIDGIIKNKLKKSSKNFIKYRAE